jgi:hypothetical protein
MVLFNLNSGEPDAVCTGFVILIHVKQEYIVLDSRESVLSNNLNAAKLIQLSAIKLIVFSIMFLIGLPCMMQGWLKFVFAPL